MIVGSCTYDRASQAGLLSIEGMRPHALIALHCHADCPAHCPADCPGAAALSPVWTLPHRLSTRRSCSLGVCLNPRTAAWAPAPLSTLSRPPLRCVSPHARRRARAPLANHAPPPHVLGLDPGYVGAARGDARTRSRHILPRFELLLCLGGQLHHHLAQQRQSSSRPAGRQRRQAVKSIFIEFLPDQMHEA